MKIESWIIRNLHDFHNCLIPKELVKAKGLDELSLILSTITGMMVIVRKEESCYIEDENKSICLNGSIKKRIEKKDYNYIARVVEYK